MQRYQKDILAEFIPQRAGPLGARKYLLAGKPQNRGVIGAPSILGDGTARWATRSVPLARGLTGHGDPSGHGQPAQIYFGAQ